MKILKLLLCSSLLVLGCSDSYGQSWEWGSQGNMIGLKTESSTIVATDANGNAFLTGGYSPEISFGKDTLVDSTLGEAYGAYFTKYNSAGTVQWAKQFFSNPECFSTSIVTDVSNNVIIAGEFHNNITIGPYNLIGNGGFFLTKCDNNGNPLWAVAGESDVYINTNALATDKSKNIFISGRFLGTLTLGAINLVASDTSYDIFTAKYDSNGNILWAKQGINISPIANYNNQSYSVATDINGNSFVTGSYNDSIVFDSYTLTSPILYNNQGDEVFLVKYAPNGNVLWARQSNIPSVSSGAIGYSITTDNAGSVYLTGAFTDTVSFGKDTLIGGGLFFIKYSANGNVLWAKSAGASQNSTPYTGYSLASDEFNHIYLAGGGGADSITFGKYTLNASPNSYYGNSFIMKFDTGGNAICGSLLGNGDPYTYVSLAVDKSGVYVYQASIVFNDTIFCATDTLTSPNQVPYVARWQNCGEQNGISSISSPKPSILLYPNPSNGAFTIAISHPELVSGSQTIQVYNMLGAKVYSNYQISKSSNYQIDLRGQPNGIYLYRLIATDGSLIGEGKLIIQK